MKTIVALLLIPVFVLYGAMSSAAEDSELRLKIEKAMQEGQVLRIQISLEKEVIGRVVSLQEQDFTLLNPLSGAERTVRWGNVQRVREATRYSAESQRWLQSLAKRRQKVTVTLLDGVVHEGRITEVTPSGFNLQDKNEATESRIAYEDILGIDQEPKGQKVVRNVMIGTAVGLVSALSILAWLLRGY